jgi:ribonucleotide monophosphatase NagD (HAD superfamily)
MGKPAKAFYKTAIDMLGADPGEAIMVGDDIHVDVAAAQNAGMQGILVKTGTFRPADLQQGIQPDAVLASVSDLPDWWRQYHQ